ncbi:type II secretion system F family protein [Defluviimonas sp. WL0075]|uniref:Type II secretion system F family protein n=1 Tax=Albidovulum sediminicola TaxID=2984331 RepID=A0ABT2Z3I7_9RHOB|nr:type II secretion system F family protein [Defluviimonas sp. WL0075]MCV2865570.1 type II secretion system F family protein [Defluviimonas sp. WL0075]
MELIDTINALLIEKLGPLGPLAAVGFFGFLLILVTLPTLLKRRVDPLSKLRDAQRAANGGATGKSQAKPLRMGGRGEKLDKFAAFLEPQTEEEMTSARLKLMRAGYRGKHAVRTFHAIQFVLGVTFLLLGAAYVLYKSTTGEINTTELALFGVGPGIAGYFLPRYWIERRLQMRQQEIQDGFPDALDMLLVCVEAGQSLDQGILRVSREIAIGYPALAEELSTVSAEVKAGKEKTSVLRAFADRAGVPDVSSFVTVMIQSQTFGTSIAEALRVYASEMRDKRVMRAEEAANKLPTKITLGTMMFTVPPLLIVIVGPSVYAMVEAFANFKI